MALVDTSASVALTVPPLATVPPPPRKKARCEGGGGGARAELAPGASPGQATPTARPGKRPRGQSAEHEAAACGKRAGSRSSEPHAGEAAAAVTAVTAVAAADSMGTVRGGGRGKEDRQVFSDDEKLARELAVELNGHRPKRGTIARTNMATLGGGLYAETTKTEGVVGGILLGRHVVWWNRGDGSAVQGLVESLRSRKFSVRWDAPAGLPTTLGEADVHHLARPPPPLLPCGAPVTIFDNKKEEWLEAEVVPQLPSVHLARPRSAEAALAPLRAC